jgi:hypothetical protein
VLYVSFPDWQALPVAARRKHGQAVNLLIFGPDPKAPADMQTALTNTSLTAVYISGMSASADVVALMVDLHAHLADGWPLGQCVEASPGKLAWLGQEACWPEPHTNTETPPTIRASPLPPRPIAPVEGLSVGVSIGEMHVAGDVIHGPKTVHHAEGDQVIRTEMSGGKLVQQAGGDQSNINRLTGEAREVSQTAQGDQVNVNSVRTPASPHNRNCPQCGHTVQSSDKFCEKCGGALL